MSAGLRFQKVSLAVLISFGAFWPFSVHLQSYLHLFWCFGRLCAHLSHLQGFQSHPPHIRRVLHLRLPGMWCSYHHHYSFHLLQCCSACSVHLPVDGDDFISINSTRTMTTTAQLPQHDDGVQISNAVRMNEWLGKCYHSNCMTLDPYACTKWMYPLGVLHLLPVR